jgi:Leucine-rich repeat (LRR) protein
MKERMISLLAVGVSASIELFCPTAHDMINENAMVTFVDAGWSIKGSGRVSSKSAWNLLGGFMEFDMDLSEVDPEVNANFYTVSPEGENCGSECYCDSRTNTSCMEMDIFEGNGQCAMSTTVHTFSKAGRPDNPDCDRWGCTAGISLPSPKVHVKAMFSLGGNMTVAINGKLNNKYHPWPSAASNRRVVETMKTRGAVIESSLWYGWVPNETACPKGTKKGLTRSNLTISNVRVMGSVVQGPQYPTRCTVPSVPVQLAFPSPPAIHSYLAIFAYAQLPFIASVAVLSAIISIFISIVDRTICPLAWCQHRPVEVALKVVAAPLLVLGQWIPLVFHIPHTEPLSVALVACLLLRITMFTNKIDSMQTGGTDPWRSSCWLLFAACWVAVGAFWATVAVYHDYIPTIYVNTASPTARCDFIRPLLLPWADCVALCVYAICLAVHALIWRIISRTQGTILHRQMQSAVNTDFRNFGLVFFALREYYLWFVQVIELNMVYPVPVLKLVTYMEVLQCFKSSLLMYRVITEFHEKQATVAFHQVHASRNHGDTFAALQQELRYIALKKRAALVLLALSGGGLLTYFTIDAHVASVPFEIPLALIAGVEICVDLYLLTCINIELRDQSFRRNRVNRSKAVGSNLRELLDNGSDLHEGLIRPRQPEEEQVQQVSSSNISKYRIGQRVSGLGVLVVADDGSGEDDKAGGAGKGTGRGIVRVGQPDAGVELKSFGTTDIAKYRVGQHVEELGGTVVEIVPAIWRAASGNGVVKVRVAEKLLRVSIGSEDAGRAVQQVSSSNISKYRIGQRVSGLGGGTISGRVVEIIPNDGDEEGRCGVLVVADDGSGEDDKAGGAGKGTGLGIVQGLGFRDDHKDVVDIITKDDCDARENDVQGGGDVIAPSRLSLLYLLLGISFGAVMGSRGLMRGWAGAFEGSLVGGVIGGWVGSSRWWENSRYSFAKCMVCSHDTDIKDLSCASMLKERERMIGVAAALGIALLVVAQVIRSLPLLMAWSCYLLVACFGIFSFRLQISSMERCNLFHRKALVGLLTFVGSSMFMFLVADIVRRIHPIVWDDSPIKTPVEFSYDTQSLIVLVVSAYACFCRMSMLSLKFDSLREHSRHALLLLKSQWYFATIGWLGAAALMTIFVLWPTAFCTTQHEIMHVVVGQSRANIDVHIHKQCKQGEEMALKFIPPVVLLWLLFLQSSVWYSMLHQKRRVSRRLTDAIKTNTNSLQMAMFNSEQVYLWLLLASRYRSSSASGDTNPPVICAHLLAYTEVLSSFTSLRFVNIVLESIHRRYSVASVLTLTLSLVGMGMFLAVLNLESMADEQHSYALYTASIFFFVVPELCVDLYMLQWHTYADESKFESDQEEQEDQELLLGNSNLSLAAISKSDWNSNLRTQSDSSHGKQEAPNWMRKVFSTEEREEGQGIMHAKGMEHVSTAVAIAVCAVSFASAFYVAKHILHPFASKCDSGSDFRVDRQSLLHFASGLHSPPDWGHVKCTAVWPQRCKNISEWKYSILQYDNHSRLIKFTLDGLQIDGTIGSELGRLTTLEAIDLSSNRLGGTIPPELSAVSGLETLSFADNMLNGPVPQQLEVLSGLHSFNLSHNLLTGSIPTQLQALTGLTSLDLSLNRLEGEIPWALLSRAHSGQLALDTCGGNNVTLPQKIGKLDFYDLEKAELDLSGRCLTGSIPSTLAGLTSLVSFDLSFNNLSSAIPSQLAALSRLTNLDLAHNFLSSTIPSALSMLAHLRYLDISDNSLVGEVPWAMLVRSGADYVGERLELKICEYDRLDGNRVTLPHNVSVLEEGSSVTLSSMCLTGTLPSQLAVLSGLHSLNLSNNFLTGKIPLELASLSHIHDFDLSNNLLIGEVPWVLLTSVSAGTLQLSMCGGNKLTLPRKVGTLDIGEKAITSLTLYGQCLAGTIPSQLAVLSQLTALNISHNSLTGTLPSELGRLTALKVATFSHNAVCRSNQHGSIVNDNNCNFSIGNDTYLLHHWSGGLSGSIPPALSALSELTSLDLSLNSLEGEIPWALLNRSNSRRLALSKVCGGNALTLPNAIGTLHDQNTLKLSALCLTGSIPSTLAGLTSLVSFDLSFNQLAKTIPSELGALTQLTSLSLRNNLLESPIPSSLRKLTLLSNLRLDNNLLVNGHPGIPADVPAKDFPFENKDPGICKMDGQCKLCTGPACCDRTHPHALSAHADPHCKLRFSKRRNTRVCKLCGYLNTGACTYSSNCSNATWAMRCGANCT